MLRQDSVMDARASVRETHREREKERERETRSLVRPPKVRLSSRRLNAHERLSPVRGSECGLSLDRPRGEAEACRPSYLTAIARLPPSCRRSIVGRSPRAVLRVIDQSRIPRDGTTAGPDTWHATSITRITSSGEWTAGIITAILYFYTYGLIDRKRNNDAVESFFFAEETAFGIVSPNQVYDLIQLYNLIVQFSILRLPLSFLCFL